MGRGLLFPPSSDQMFFGCTLGPALQRREAMVGDSGGAQVLDWTHGLAGVSTCSCGNPRPLTGGYASFVRLPGERRLLIPLTIIAGGPISGEHRAGIALNTC